MIVDLHDLAAPESRRAAQHPASAVVEAVEGQSARFPVTDILGADFKALTAGFEQRNAHALGSKLNCQGDAHCTGARDADVETAVARSGLFRQINDQTTAPKCIAQCGPRGGQEDSSK